MLSPLLAIMIESHLGRIADEFGQRFDRAPHAFTPVAREHPVGKRVPAGIAGVLGLRRVLVPA